MLRSQKGKEENELGIIQAWLTSDLDSGVKETPKNNSKSSPAAPFYVADSLQLNIGAEEKQSHAYLVT